jgi:hypothetical protein
METTPTSRANKLDLQSMWLDRRMADNPQWKNSLGSQRTLVVRDRKVFVAWRMGAGKPEIVDVLRAMDVSISFTAGLTIMFASRSEESIVRVTAYPREIFPGIFAWTPPFSEVRFCPFSTDDPSSVWRTSVPMMVRSRAQGALADGEIRLWTLKEFRALWPDVSL